MTIDEELTNDKIKAGNEYDLTLTTNVNKQMGTYVNATTSRLTKLFLECTKESPPKRVAKNLMENDHNNPLIVSGTLDELVVSGTSDGNDSDKSYHPSSDESDDDAFIEIKKRINYTYDWFMGTGIKKSSLSEGAKKNIVPQDIIDDDSAEILDFVEVIHKERLVDNVISDELETRSFASSIHMTEISATARHQNSSTISLLDLAQLFDKVTDAEHYAMKANQEETLCWINYGKEFII
ncbi:1034_t:CDS:2, partial [Acaulospora morrowiae]